MVKVNYFEGAINVAGIALGSGYISYALMQPRYDLALFGGLLAIISAHNIKEMIDEAKNRQQWLDAAHQKIDELKSSDSEEVMFEINENRTEMWVVDSL